MEGSPDEFEEGDGMQTLANILSTCPDRSPDFLQAIVTNENVEPVCVKGVRWILDRRYYYKDYVWNGLC